MNRYYVDTSIAVDALFVDGAAADWFESATADQGNLLVSSRLLQTELTRVLRRERRSVADRDALLDYMATIPITESILASAEAITEHVKTLDAIHLASAISLGSSATLVSHDAQTLRLADLIGIRTFDPIAAEIA